MEGLRKRLKFAVVFSIPFVILFYGFVGWGMDHSVLLGLIVGLTLAHNFGYQVVLALAGFIGFTILYSAITYIPNYSVSDVNIKELYDLEVALFGVIENGQRISLCEWFSTRFSDGFSLYFGFSYLLWIPGPMFFALYLLVKDKKAVIEFAYTYLLTNIIGLTFYYIYPAAPPWYYLEYGDVLDTSTRGSEALLSEFDRLTGTSIFHSIYNKNVNVFGAIPSLHSAYPLLGIFFAYRHGHKKFLIFFILMGIGTWIGAVYSQHHYVIDVLLGLLCATVAYFTMVKVIFKTNWFERFRRWYQVELT